jgi:hypothetical protein
MNSSVFKEIHHCRPGTFLQWRSELSLTVAEMAAEAERPTAEQERRHIPVDHHVKVVTAFKRLAKKTMPIESSCG